MTLPTSLRFLPRAAVAGALALLLAACMLIPGKFASEMVLLRDGTFAYSYEGEIHLMSMGKLAQLGQAMEQGEFMPETCYDEETFEERECSADELAQQRANYEQTKADKAKTDAEEAAKMKEMFGGIDPTDPASGDELAKRIERQAGFERVVHKGDGLFDVTFRVAGRLDHDFIFPTFERLPLGNYFVYAGRRDDGSVRVDAPGFASQAGANPMQAMMSGMNQGNADSGMPAGAPVPEGTFTLITDGEILANNTDEGAAADPRGRKLTWTVNRSTTAAPTALVRLAN
mgnify:CR=1 FL=1